MTDSPSSSPSGAQGDDQPGQDQAGPGQPVQGQPVQGQPWFPPPGQQGAYGPTPPPYDYGQAADSAPAYGPPAGGQQGYGQHPGSQSGYGQPGYGQPGYGQPGYGPARGAWPTHAPSAPKPGVIPLRPLVVGEILDGAFSSIRQNPKATLGLSAILLTITGVISTT